MGRMGAGHSHHGHSHGHHHHGASSGNRRRLAFTLGLVAVYMVAEFVGGLLSGSLALLADAGHMLSDAAALGLSLFAISISRRPPTPRRTWGYYRIEILAALVNGVALVVLSIFILREAIERFHDPGPIEAPVLMAIATGGLLVNLVSLGILSGGRDESLNVRGAWLHVLTDALGSVQAIAAGALIWGFGWTWADPAASVLISLLVIYSAWGLLRDTVGVLMEGAPPHIDVDEVRNCLMALPCVVDVHDLHVWTITSGMESLSCHVVVEDDQSYCDALTEVRTTLHGRFGIDHLTIQVEPAEMEEHGVHA
jgi:cobalt-zinc-cadmium efflux system protein